MIKKFSDFIEEGMWSSVMRRSKTGEERREDKDNTQYIDLGLPSGTLWADKNLGADEPEECGDYYAWGETETKKEYTWDNYKWGKDCTKYNKKDHKKVLDNEDDVVYVRSKGKAHIPTKEQIQELLDNTTSELKTINGVMGNLYTSKVNENFIFIPYSSDHDGSSTSGVSIWTRCWSSSLFLNNPSYVYYLNSYRGELNFGYYRCYGCSVRGVMDK